MIGHIARASHVIGTGLVALDVVHGLDPSCAPGLYAGGTCGNVLAALAYLGWASFPVARLASDFAGLRVAEDLSGFGVKTDYLSLAPVQRTPVVIQRAVVDAKGQVSHRFSMRCPKCRAWFPQYQPVTRAAMADLLAGVSAPDVVFVDRLSAGAVALAEDGFQRGALVYFEPSAQCEPSLLERMLAVTHVLKYSADRTSGFAAVRTPRPTHLLEVETRGAAGLRFRGTMLGRQGQAWRALPSFVAAELRDAAGAGDWLSAGFIDFVAQAGLEGFDGLPADIIEAGLRTGQAYSAWACGFEGARGGMYQQTVGTVRDIVAATLNAGRVVAPPSNADRAIAPDILAKLCSHGASVRSA